MKRILIPIQENTADAVQQQKDEEMGKVVHDEKSFPDTGKNTDILKTTLPTTSGN